MESRLRDVYRLYAIYGFSFVCVCLPEGVCGRGRLAESSRAPAI